MQLHCLLVVSDVSDLRVPSSTVAEGKYGVWRTQLLHK